MTSGHAATAPRRVLLKLSGEALMGRREFGLDPATVERTARRRMYGSQISFIAIADSTRVGVPACSSASWIASPFMTVASMPM
jgi:hypothetical protein